MKSFRSPDQLVTIYRLSQDGHNITEIAQQEGLPYASARAALRNITKYLKGKDRNQRKHSTNYKQAVKVIRRDKRQEPSQARIAPHRQPQTTSQGDNFTFLKASFDRFQDAVSTFIEVETNSRYTELRDENRALQEDNKALRKEMAKLQEEIERLKREEPQTMNWVDTLQNKLTKEET
jgi:hypothetical protein